MNTSVNEDEDYNEEIEKLAEQLFKNDYPDRDWGIQAIGPETGPIRGRVTFREKQKYCTMAKDMIEKKSK